MHCRAVVRVGVSGGGSWATKKQTKISVSVTGADPTRPDCRPDVIAGSLRWDGSKPSRTSR